MSTTEYKDRTLFEETGIEIGTVRDVISHPTDLQPEWLVVKTGWRRGEHLVPIDAVSERGQNLTVPFNKQMVKDSPVVKTHVAPARAQRQLTYAHYGMRAPEDRTNA